MSEINVDVTLPNAVSVDVTSPTQILSANVLIPGSQGPRGEKGDQGLNAEINNLTGKYLFLTGLDGVYIFDNSINTIYISGNSGYFESKFNKLNNNVIFTTGNQVKSGRLIIGNDENGVVDPNSSYSLSVQSNSPATWLEILNHSGAGQGVFFGIQDNNLEQYNWQGGDIIFYTSSNPSNGIERLRITNSGTTLFKDRPMVNGTGVLLSGEVANLPETIVYRTGDQIISGNKNFIDSIIVGDETEDDLFVVSGNEITFGVRPTVNGTGILISGDLTNSINSLSGALDASGIDLTNSINSLSGALDASGIDLTNSINSLSGDSVLLYGDQNILGQKTFSGSNTIIGNDLYVYGSGYFISGIKIGTSSVIIDGNTVLVNNDAVVLNAQFTGFSGDINSTFSTITNLDLTGTTLNNKINSLSGTLNSSGINLYNAINALSGDSVLLYGNQGIDGIKIFRDKVYINSLYVTGTETILNTTNNNISSPYLLLNLTGGLTDGGIFFVTGEGLTGINDTGVIFGFDNITKTWHFGQGTRLTDVSTLDEVMGYHDLSDYSGYANNRFSTITNLTNTGDTLQTNINNLSGYINSSSSNIIFTTGDQTISGNKIFINNLEVQGTGIFNAVDLSNISDFQFSGTNINLIDGNVYVTGNGSIYISGKPVLTGVDLTNYYTKNNPSGFITGVDLTNYYTKNNPSGFITGVDLTNYYTKNNPSGFITGVDLTNYVQLTGPQNIAGAKTFISNALFQNDIIVTGNIRGSGSAYFNDNLNITNNLTVGGSINNPNLVLTKGKQTISGDKTFADTISLNAYTGNGYDTSNLDFRLNIAGNTNENAGISIDAYGINGPQILMRRARGIPTGLSGVLKDDVLFNLQGRGYISGLNQYSSNSRAAIRSLAAEDWVVRQGYTGQGTYISFRTTNIGSGLAMDKVIVNTSGLNVVDGNIYISGNQVLTGVDLSNYYTKNNPSGFITGVDLSNYYTKNNPSGFITGVDLSAYLTSTNASNTYVTKSNGQFTNRPTVNGTGVLLSGEAASLPDTIIYTTGNQIISGNKTFINNIQVSGTGIFNNFNLNEIDVLNLSGISVNITGNVSLNTRPTVNGSGVLLVGEAAASSNNFFVLSFDHTSDQPAIGGGHNYFAPGNLGFNASGPNRRYIQVLESGTARKASWQHIAGTSLPSPALNSTGYFINATTNTLGVISTSILSTNTNIPNNFTGLITPPVPLNIGDFVVCSLFTPAFTINPSGLRDTVRVYCY